MEKIYVSQKGGGNQTPGTPHTFPLDPPMNKVQTMTIQKYKKLRRFLF